MQAPSVGLEDKFFALVLRRNSRVDTWQNGTYQRFALTNSSMHMAVGSNPEGLCIAHVVSDLCRNFSRVPSTFRARSMWQRRNRHSS